MKKKRTRITCRRFRYLVFETSEQRFEKIMLDAGIVDTVSRHLDTCPKCSAKERRDDKRIRDVIQSGMLNPGYPTDRGITIEEDARALLAKHRHLLGRGK